MSVFIDLGPKDKTPIVFIHGFPFSRAMWDNQLQTFQETNRVIAYDVRGHGESETGDGQFTIEFCVDDWRTLLDTLGIKKAVVCGLSMGGYIALRAYERHPERFAGLVLCDTRSEADTNESKVKRTAAIQSIKRDGVPAFAENFLKSLFPAESFTQRPDAVDRVRKMMVANKPLGLCGALLALASRTDTTSVLPTISVPTLALVGEQDAITPRAVVENMARQIPGARFQVIPQAGHVSSVENPSVFNRYLGEFLATIR